jgi:signal transduction histidine kinase
MLLLVFLTNGFITFWNLRRLHGNAAEVEHLHDILSELKTLQIAMADAETGMRGFVITNDKQFLQPYSTAQSAVTQSLVKLGQLLETDTTHTDSARIKEQIELFEDLKRQVAESMVYIHGTVKLHEEKLREQSESDAAKVRIQGGLGKGLMDEVRKTLSKIHSNEQAALFHRQVDSQRSYVTALTTGVLTTLLGMGLIVFAFTFIRREMARREEAVLALRHANDFLEQRVIDRTSELSHANLLMLTEIDERRRAEEQVRLFADELQRSNRELEQFAAVASHDLQEPLRKIQAFGDRLRLRYRDQLGEQGQDYIDRLQASAKRMRKLIDDLLEYSRVTTKAQPFAPVNLTEIVQEVADDLEARLHQTGGRVEIGELPVVEASPLQMRQLFQNLISNALKFRRPDEPPLVRIMAANPPEGSDGHGLQCQIIVEDNGIGFEPEYGERIFELFQRLHGREDYEGTGIGLAICRKIVDRHNGHIVAHSSPGSGTRFVVTLPFEQSA